MCAPVIQREPFDIPVVMQSYRLVYTAEWVHSSDRDLQPILWWKSSVQPIQEFRLNIIKYRIGPTSLLANKRLMVIEYMQLNTEKSSINEIKYYFTIYHILAGPHIYQYE